ncbi:MAG: TolC family protein [Kiritimatiellae bacterium]|nr:TolC family protein [Kiritimatiellia bacterium]
MMKLCTPRIFNLSALSFALAALLCSCSTVERARNAQKEGNRLDGEYTVLSADAGIKPGAVVALKQLEDIALRFHPAIQQASQAVETARCQLKVVKSRRLPQVSAGGGYSRSTSNSRFHRGKTEMAGSWSGSLGLDLLLYDFGKLDAKEKQAIEDILASEEQFRQSQVSVLYNVRATFFEVHRTGHLLLVALDNLRQYREHLDEAKSMFKVGTCRKYDVTKAEVDYGNAQLEVITASNNLTTAKADLNAALGFADSPVYKIAASKLPKKQIDDDAEGLMAFARKNSPALAVQAARERAASAYVDETIANLYPDVTAGISLDLSGKGFPLVVNWSWFGRLAEDLFTGFRRTALIDAAVAELRAARAKRAETEQTLYLDLVKAVARRDSARQSSLVSQKTYEQAKENFAIVDEQFRVGTSSSIERTDAQVQVTQAKADMVRSRYDEQIAQAKIASLVGLLQEPPEPPEAEKDASNK